jgi:hypothetical protein
MSHFRKRFVKQITHTNEILFFPNLLFLFSKIFLCKITKFLIFILPFRQLKGLSESRKKIGGFHLKKTIDDVITRKQMTAWNFI